jgi:branched-chain amino acid transport system permease protein
VSDRWYVRAALGAGLLAGLLAAAIIAVEALGSATDKRVAVTFLVNLVAVLGIQTFMGNSGIVTFGHVAFVGIGAYAGALMTMEPATKRLAPLIPDAPGFILDAHLSFPLATVVAIAVAVVVAVAVGPIFARLSGAAGAIASLSFLVVVRTVLGNWSDVTRGPKTFFGVPPLTTTWWALGWAIAAIAVARLFRESSVGLRLRATSSDELAGRAVGVDVLRARTAAWVLGAGIAAVSGVLYAHLILAFGPGQFFLELTFLLIVMAMVGGPTVSGAVLGAAGISLLTEVLRRGEAGFTIGPVHVEQALGLTTLVLSALIMLIVVARPKGLLGRWELDEWIVRGARRWGSRNARAAQLSSQGRGATPRSPQDQ